MNRRAARQSSEPYCTHNPRVSVLLKQGLAVVQNSTSVQRPSLYDHGYSQPLNVKNPQARLLRESTALARRAVELRDIGLALVKRARQLQRQSSAMLRRIEPIPKN